MTFSLTLISLVFPYPCGQIREQEKINWTKENCYPRQDQIQDATP